MKTIKVRGLTSCYGGQKYSNVETAPRTGWLVLWPHWTTDDTQRRKKAEFPTVQKRLARTVTQIDYPCLRRSLWIAHVSKRSPVQKWKPVP